MTRGKAKQEFRDRRRPDLPVDPPVARGDDLFRGPEIAIARSTISELKRDGLSATSLSIESCVLNRVALPDSTFATITLPKDYGSILRTSTARWSIPPRP